MTNTTTPGPIPGATGEAYAIIGAIGIAIFIIVLVWYLYATRDNYK